MALNNVIRRVSASKVVPLAIRSAAGCQRYHLHSSAILCSVQRHIDIGGSGKIFNRSPPPEIQPYSSRRASDQRLINVLDNEIQRAVEHEGAYKIEENSEAFPFKFEDHPIQNCVTLFREYHDETITVDVGMPRLDDDDDYDDYDDDNDDDDDDKDDEGGGSSCAIPLVVRVSRDQKYDLEFGCTAYPDEISIESVCLKDPDNSEDELAFDGPDFSDLDKNLQKAFYEYLEIRGVKPSTANSLHKYMSNKDNREYLLWLNNTKQFIDS